MAVALGEEQSRALSRLNEKLGIDVGAPLALQSLGQQAGEALRDATMNLMRVLAPEPGRDGGLKQADRVLVAAAVAQALKAPNLVQWFKTLGTTWGVSQDRLSAALAVTYTCTTYNGYYRFRSQLDSEAPFEAFRPELRATPFMRSALDKWLVELICVAVSSVNGCSHCVKGHVAATLENGGTHAQIDEAIRLEAVLAGLAPYEYVLSAG